MPNKADTEQRDTQIHILNKSLSHLPTDADVIFHKSVPIMVKSSMMESNTRLLTLKIEKMVQVPQNQHILSITLTDESDPFFLYSLRVNENDFHALKSDQALLVDFAVFPKSLVMLLEQCLQCQHDEHPKFVAVLLHHPSNKSATLSVQETNQFRHLQQISLTLCAATTDTLREYLGKSLILYKTEYNNLTQILQESKKALHGSKLERKKCEQHLSEIKQKYEQCICDLKTSHSAMVHSLKEDHLQRMEEVSKKLSDEKESLEKELNARYKELEYKHSKLQDEFGELNAMKLALENRHKNQTQMVSETQQQFEANKQELSKLRAECQQLEGIKYEQDKQINQQLVEMAALKQQIKDKGEIALNSSTLLQSEREQKKSLEEQVKMYKANAERVEKKVKECVKEINKGNQIISHLQNEIRNQRQKNKLKEHKMHSMQHESNSKADECKRLNEEMLRKDETLRKYQQEVKELKDALRACKDKLQQSQKAIEQNQRCITYLNKQLTDSQLGHNMFATANNNVSSSSAMAATSPFLSNVNNINAPSSILPHSTVVPRSALRRSPPTVSTANHSNHDNNNNNKTSSPSSYFPQ